jgi:catechol 2,3-dioxygenase-like lactoylglutathione lyase family enzyme/predicted nucleotidyltransferase
MTNDVHNQMLSANAGPIVQRLTHAFGELPQVVAVVLAGSRSAATSDPESDFDLYVYTLRDVPVAFRRALLGDSAEIDNRFWEPGDEWTESSTGTQIDIMYRSPEWTEGQLDRALVRQEAALGYTTCFWYNVIHSKALFDPRGWYGQLQQRAHVPYAEGLRRAVVMKNWPVLRRNHSSYRRQIELALNRGDAVSVQHRVTALLASFFDVWFAVERQPHPGEKRLLSHLAEPWVSHVRALLDAQPKTLLTHIDSLLDPLDARLVEEGLLAPAGQIEHAAAWVADLERACAFYERWFKATIGPKYSSTKRPFTSRFLLLSSGARLELMASPEEPPRLAHIAVSVGSREAVERLVAEMKAAGVPIVSGPRVTGDGYYEAVVTDTEGNLVEITQ